jgi:hypothetical protein
MDETRYLKANHGLVMVSIDTHGLFSADCCGTAIVKSLLW